jgi:uracil phosphoribosyltransferase
MAVTILDHPLASHLLASLREKDAAPQTFRKLTYQLTAMLALRATAGLSTKPSKVETPLEVCDQTVLGQELAIVPVLRAGLGMVEPIVDMFPAVSVGFVGLERSDVTAIAGCYYCKLPEVAGRFTLCLDPMLATGGSASQALTMIKKGGPAKLVMISIVAAPEGVARLDLDHPDVPIVTAAIDRGLDERKYILPGLGDFGDRLYGT